MLRGIYPGTARDVLLRNAQTRDSLCTRQWATTPALHYGASLPRGRTCTFISDERPTLWSTAFETCARNLFNPPHENIPDTIFAITVRNGGVVEIDFFYGPIILSSCFSMPRLWERKFFLYESHKFEELFLSPKKALFVKLLKLAQWIYLNYLLFHITLYIKKNKHASVTFYVYTFHFSEYSLLPRLNDPPNPPPWKEIIFITTERGHLSPPRNKTELNLVRDEEKYYPGISSN